MKLKLAFLLFLCPFFRLSAQGLKVGEKLPELTLTGVSNYKTPALNLADLHGKLVLIDFWATWCSPCVTMIPVMENLQAEFGEKIQFLPVAYQSREEVTAFLAKQHQGKPATLPEITGDKTLAALFPHTYLPHYVWVAPGGNIIAITGYEDITREKIRAALAGTTATLERKRDTTVAYDATKPLLIGGNGGNGSTLVYQALFTGFTEGLPAGYTISPKDGPGNRHITARNLTIPQLYALAYCEDKRYLGHNRIRLEVRDTTVLNSRLHGSAFHEWMSRHHVFCYEITMPPGLSGDIYRLMQTDLARLLPDYTATLQVRKVPCWVLERTTTEDKLKTRGGTPQVTAEAFGAELRNTYLGQLISRLRATYWQNQLPIIDETAYTGPLDLSISARLSDVPSVNAALEKYGLKFTERERPLEVLVIKDSN
jgi:thiol-disulfide isomerase/thioredoxin